MYNLLNADHFVLFGHSFKNNISFSLFGKQFVIYYYAIAIVTGIIACTLVARPMMKKRGLKTDLLIDLLIGIIPLAIIGARLWYVLFDIKSFLGYGSFWKDFVKMISIRDGGLAIYGGVIGGALGIIIVCKIHKVNMFKVLDIGATLLPLGQAIGRWGNFFNQEVYGQTITNPTWQFFPIAVEIDTSGAIVWHQALFFYESFLNILAFIGLYMFFFKRKGTTNGYSVALYFISYGLIRAILENFRESQYNLPLFGISGLKIQAMVLVSIGLIIAGVVILICLLQYDKKNKVKITDEGEV